MKLHLVRRRTFLYSDNIRTRIHNHDLEETVFHESVHATLDEKYLRARKRHNAQRQTTCSSQTMRLILQKKEDFGRIGTFRMGNACSSRPIPCSWDYAKPLGVFEDLFLDDALLQS